jgi:hypothetical protein
MARNKEGNMLTRRGFIASAAAAASVRAVPIIAKAKPRWIVELVRDKSGMLRAVERLIP